MSNIYRHLDVGEKILEGDEYHNGMDWMQVPDFLVGSRVQDKSSLWRRTVIATGSSIAKKKWFSFLFSK
jgi:hypothetical protein